MTITELAYTLEETIDMVYGQPHFPIQGSVLEVLTGDEDDG